MHLSNSCDRNLDASNIEEWLINGCKQKTYGIIGHTLSRIFVHNNSSRETLFRRQMFTVWNQFEYYIVMNFIMMFNVVLDIENAKLFYWKVLGSNSNSILRKIESMEFRRMSVTLPAFYQNDLNNIWSHWEHETKYITSYILSNFVLFISMSKISFHLISIVCHVDVPFNNFNQFISIKKVKMIKLARKKLDHKRAQWHVFGVNFYVLNGFGEYFFACVNFEARNVYFFDSLS